MIIIVALISNCRKLCSLMEEYIVRVGQQAVIVCCTPKLSQAGSFRVYGSQPLEGIVSNCWIIGKLEASLFGATLH